MITCCEQWAKLRRDFHVTLRVLHTLGANTPRHTTQLYQILQRTRGQGYIDLVTSERCPCNECPDPALVREFVSRMLTRHPEGVKNHAAVDALATEILGDIDKERLAALHRAEGG